MHDVTFLSRHMYWCMIPFYIICMAAYVLCLLSTQNKVFAHVLFFSKSKWQIKIVTDTFIYGIIFRCIGADGAKIENVIESLIKENVCIIYHYFNNNEWNINKIDVLTKINAHLDKRKEGKLVGHHVKMAQIRK